MPARGRRRPTIYRSAEYYINIIQTYHPDQESLKTQLTELFAHIEVGNTVLTRFRIELNDGLLVSIEVFANPDVYRCFRDALESRELRVPIIVHDKTAESFVAKKLIAEIWQNPDDKVKRYSLLQEYHNIPQLVVNANKDILSERQEASTRMETEQGPSS